MGVAFPEPLAVVESLLGIALDLEQDRLPLALAVVGHTRALPSSEEHLQMLKQPSLVPRASLGASSGRDGAADRRGSALDFVFFSPAALRMGSRSGHAPATPSTLLSAVMAQRCGFWRASRDGERALAIAAGTALVDASATMPVVRFLLDPAQPVDSTTGSALAAGIGDANPIPGSAAFATAWRMPAAKSTGSLPPVVELRVRLGVIGGSASAASPCSMIGPGAVLSTPGSPSSAQPSPTVDSPRPPASQAPEAAPDALASVPPTTPTATPSATLPPTTPTATPSAASASLPPRPSTSAASPTERPGLLLSVFTTLFDKDRSTLAGEQKYLIQRNTLIAFANLGESVEMTVFTDSPQIQGLCAELSPSVVCSDNFRTNSHGTPVLKSMYLHVENVTEAPFYGYVNADIIFTDALLKALRAVQRGIVEGVVHKRVLVMGKRTNFEMPFPLTMSSPMVLSRSSDFKVIDQMASRGKVFQPDAEDFFFFHRNSLDWSQVADFVIGRVAYDNWLVDHAFHQGLDRVDITSTVHAVHQTGNDGNMAGHTPRVDSNWNKDLATKHGGGYDHGTTDHGNFETRWHDSEMRLVARPKWHAPNRDELLEEQSAAAS